MLNHFYVILAVGVFIKDSKNRILIVNKSPDEKVDAGLWTIPGGKVEKNESIIDALKRETKEEVNLDISNYRWIGEDVFENNNYWYHAQHFLCQVKKTGTILLEKSLLEFHWLELQEIYNFDLPVNIKKRLLELFKLSDISKS